MPTSKWRSFHRSTDSHSAPGGPHAVFVRNADSWVEGAEMWPPEISGPVNRSLEPLNITL